MLFAVFLPLFLLSKMTIFFFLMRILKWQLSCLLKLFQIGDLWVQHTSVFNLLWHPTLSALTVIIDRWLPQIRGGPYDLKKRSLINHVYFEKIISAIWHYRIQMWLASKQCFPHILKFKSQIIIEIFHKMKTKILSKTYRLFKNTVNFENDEK